MVVSMWVFWSGYGLGFEYKFVSRGIDIKINSLSSNYCFSCRNVFQNSVNALSEIINHFRQKDQNFVWFGPYDFIQI